jgi:hypothetical protein
MRRSENLTELFAALALAQGEIVNAKKDTENTFFKSNYADLASVISAIREPLSKNGLAYIQLVTVRDKMVSIETILTHKAGQFLAETLDLPVVQNNPQGIGSTITYGRRYSLMAMVGVAAEDDDGNAGSKGEASSEKARPPNPSSPPPLAFITETQASVLVDLLKPLGAEAWKTWKEFSGAWHITRLGELAAAEYPAALAQLQARAAAAKVAKDKTPPNPNQATPSIPPFDWTAYRTAVVTAPTEEAANSVFRTWVEQRKPPLSPEEDDEAQNILREACAKFWVDETSN